MARCAVIVQTLLDEFWTFPAPDAPRGDGAVAARTRRPPGTRPSCNRAPARRRRRSTPGDGRERRARRPPSAAAEEAAGFAPDRQPEVAADQD